MNRKWSCEIERVDDGFILRNTSSEDTKDNMGTKVFEDYEDTFSDHESEIVPLKELFYELMDFFGVYNSKHENKALDISIVDRSDFPLEYLVKELKKENEDLTRKNITLTESMRYQQQKFIKNTEVLDMTRDLKRDIESGSIPKLSTREE